MRGIIGVGNEEQVTHYIYAIGSVWEWNGSNYIISNDNDLYFNSLVTIGNTDLDYKFWPGFNWKWLYGGPYWGLGLYRVYNSKNYARYFYLDARDARYGDDVYNPDFWVLFNNTYNSHSFKASWGDDWSPIANGSVIRIWEMHGESPSTAGLQNYWSNVLVYIWSSNHPKIIWGPHPTFSATHYKVYRAITQSPTNHPELLSYTLIATVGSETYEYIDNDMWSPGEIIEDYAYYYVKAYNSGSNTYSSASNIIEVGGEYSPYKKAVKDDEINTVTDFDLFQNYPNPFNPATEIKYAIDQKDFIRLKVYDILGNLVSELVNEEKEPGIYSVNFNGSNLASGVYIFTLSNSRKTLSQKMILSK